MGILRPGGTEDTRRQQIAVDTMQAVMYTRAQMELDLMRHNLLQGAAIKMRDREKVGGRLDGTTALVESMRDIVAAYDNREKQNGKAG